MKEKNMELGDELMAKVAGGFLEKTGPAIGQNIVCPYCKGSAASNFKMTFIDGEDMAEYICQNPACLSDPHRNYGVFYADPEGVCRPEK